MKKIFFSVITFMMIMSMSAQNVARECVLFEVFTGVNCPYCPAAANGIAQMMEEGLAVAPLGYQTSAFSTPEFYTNETNARASYYNDIIEGYPTAIIDGMLFVIGGGDASQSNYSSYRSKYNQRINIDSPFTIDLSYQAYEGTQCEVTATVTKVGECSGTDVRVFIAFTQSHIQKSWQGMSELNCVVRDMIPTQNGTPFSGDSQVVTGIFDLNGYPKEDCNLVAWVQNYSGTKEVYQAVMISMKKENLQYDLAVNKIEEFAIGSCSGIVSPRVTIKSMGSEPVTSMILKSYDNNGLEISSYQWNGNLNQDETVEIVMPEFNCRLNPFSVAVLDPNGQQDEFLADNYTKSFELASAPSTDGAITMQIKTGSNPQDITFEVKNTETNEIVRTWSYEESSHVYTEEINLIEDACYSLTIRNQEGTGLNDGFFIIKDSENNTLYQVSNALIKFRYSLALEFDCDGSLDVNELNDNDVNVYPNPVTSLINISGISLANVEVYNSVGQLVYEKSGDFADLQIDAVAWANGLYYVSIMTENGENITKKVIVNK